MHSSVTTICGLVNVFKMLLEESAVDDTNVNWCGSDNHSTVIGIGIWLHAG